MNSDNITMFIAHNENEIVSFVSKLALFGTMLRGASAKLEAQVELRANHAETSETEKEGELYLFSCI